MLRLSIVLSENYDERTHRFVKETFELELEHSLVSLSKWESKWEKPFLDLNDEDKTEEQIMDYIRFMILTPEYPSDILTKFSREDVEKINEYLNSKQTATWFNEPNTLQGKKTNQSRTITSELVYYWMTAYRIPWEVQYWHLGRLFTLIKVFSAEEEKSQPKKMNKDRLADRRAENARRLATLNTSG